MGRNPQIEEWAATVAPDVGALQHLLSTLDDQRAVWSQVLVFRWRGSQSQRGDRDASQKPPWGTRTKGEGDLEAAEGPGQEPGAVGAVATSNPSVASLRLGEVERSIAGTSGAEDAADGNRAAA